MKPNNQTDTALQVVRPWTVILSFVGAFLLLIWSGRTATKKDWHDTFTRFHPMIAPDSMYQPTVGEMCAIVRARCRKDQTLVIVGGNSILLGVGQPADRMWTRVLQDLLGPNYAVINMAFRGASATDGGALVAEALREEYPRQIYIANVAPMQGAPTIGADSYRFILFDAFYKGMLLPWKPREDAISEFFSEPIDHAHRLEVRLGAELDAWLHFNDFWNRWSYCHFFTFPTTLMPHYPEAYRARSGFSDEENDYEIVPLETRFTPQIMAIDQKITNQSTEPFYTKDEHGAWKPAEAAHQQFRGFADRAFPTPLRKRTLILVGRSSAIYVMKMPPDLLARDDLAFKDSIKIWESTGYQALGYGRDFLPTDYGDRSHLTSRGGEKLAAVVATKIKSIAQELGYLTP